VAVDEVLASRIRAAIKSARGAPVEEKKMFGGIAFMVDDKMCVGVHESKLMVRVGPVRHDEAINEPGARIMDFSKRPMVGFLFVDPPGYRTGRDLDKWVRWSLEYVATIPAKRTAAKKGPAKKSATSKPKA
jgi:TfoX/Sxy family transcriptional regulator of competence genes